MEKNKTFAYPRRPLAFALALAALIAASSLSVYGVPSPALSLGWYGDGACDDAEAQNPGDPSGCRYDAREQDCNDGVDNDSDERADAQDSDCWHGDPVCDRESAENVGNIGDCSAEIYAVHCADGVDNDADGYYDCSDTDCAAAPSCRVCAAVVEVCDNGQDDDCDGLVDGDDQDCGCSSAWYNVWDPRCGCAPTELDANGDCAPDTYLWASACSDGNDNDADGYYDCSDTDCAEDSSCGSRPEDCWNTLDDDLDGAADCQDSDCAGPQCGTACPFGTVPGITPSGTYNCVPAVEECGNGIDDDADGLADCSDADCAGNPGCGGGRCGGASYCDPSCPEYSLCICNPSDPSCGGGGCTGSFCDCNPSDPSCQGETCGNGSCGGGETCESCASDCGRCPPKYEICGNGEDDDGNGAADCDDQACSGTCECTNDCGCTGDDCGGACDDSTACNYGEYEACTYCECDGIDNNDDGSTDEEGESCGGGGSSGCTDPDATNYDRNASSEPHEENCEYSDTRSIQIEIDDVIASRQPSFLAAALGPVYDLFAGDPNNFQGFSVFIRLSLWKDKNGRATLTFSGQVAPETGSGRFPMGAIQVLPTASFNKSGLTTTEAYKSDDDVQKYIHQAIDQGFYGEYAAKKHTFLQKMMDVKGWFKR